MKATAANFTQLEHEQRATMLLTINQRPQHTEKRQIITTLLPVNEDTTARVKLLQDNLTDLAGVVGLTLGKSTDFNSFLQVYAHIESQNIAHRAGGLLSKGFLLDVYWMLGQFMANRQKAPVNRL